MFELKLESLLYSSFSTDAFPFKSREIQQFYGTITIFKKNFYNGKIEFESYNNCLCRINLKDTFTIDITLFNRINICDMCQILYNNRYLTCYFDRLKFIFYGETNILFENFSFILKNSFKDKIKI